MNYTIDGTTYYIEGGVFHRDNGPAVMSPDYQEWYSFGKLHRGDGPARMFKKTLKAEWWFHDQHQCSWDLAEPNFARFWA